MWIWSQLLDGSWKWHPSKAGISFLNAGTAKFYIGPVSIIVYMYNTCMLEISPSLSQLRHFMRYQARTLWWLWSSLGLSLQYVFIGHCVPWLQSSPNKRILCHLPFAMYCWRLTLRLLNFQKVKTFKKVWTLNAHTCVWFPAIQWLFRSTRRKLSTISSNSPADWFPSRIPSKPGYNSERQWSCSTKRPNPLQDLKVI